MSLLDEARIQECDVASATLGMSVKLQRRTSLWSNSKCTCGRKPRSPRGESKPTYLSDHTEASKLFMKSKSKCKLCYGKGYATRFWGGSICKDDFHDLITVYYRVPYHLSIKFCSCRNGKRLMKTHGAIAVKELKNLKRMVKKHNVETHR